MQTSTDSCWRVTKIWLLNTKQKPADGTFLYRDYSCVRHLIVALVSRRINFFSQFDGFRSRVWVAYTTPPGGGIGQTTLCQNLGNLVFQSWNDEGPRIDSARVTKVWAQQDKLCGGITNQTPKPSQGLDCYSVGCTVVWLRSSGWSAQSPRAVHGLPESLLADKAISDPKVGKEWCQQTNRAVFTWKKPCRGAGKVIY